MTGPEFIVGLGRRSDMIGSVGLSEAERPALGPEEAAVLARVGTGAKIGDVLDRAGMPPTKAAQILVALRTKGLIRLLAAGSQVGHDAPEMAEAVDLEAEPKREILDFAARLDSADHFALLGLSPAADAGDVRRRYYDLSKKFHPDRFYGRKLGTFGPRIERIFKRLSEAFDVLTDEARRGQYLASHPELSVRKAASSPAETADEARREAERKSRLARHPYLARQGRVQELIARAQAAMDKDPGKAVPDLALASQLAPQDKRVAEMLAEARRRQGALKAAAEYDEGLTAEQTQGLAQAIPHYRAAVTQEPANAKYTLRLVRCLLALSSEEALAELRPVAHRLVELDPKNADHHATYGHCLKALGKDKLAKRAFEAALELDPNHADAKAQLKKLRWTF